MLSARAIRFTPLRFVFASIPIAAKSNVKMYISLNRISIRNLQFNQRQRTDTFSFVK